MRGFFWRQLCATLGALTSLYAARIFREKQQKKGLYQTTFWVTLAQAGAVREWLRKGGDVEVLRKS